MNTFKVSDPKRLRAFGLILGVLLAFFGWRWGRKGYVVAPYLLPTALLSIATALIRPTLLGPLERRWMKAARVLARVNTFVVLGLMYYLLLVPLSLVMRLTSDDPLDRASRRAETYWKPKRTGDDSNAYERQF